MPQLSVRQLFDDKRERLKLTWVACREGGGRTLTGEGLAQSGVGLVGHLNLIHPWRLEVLGPMEIRYLASLTPDALQQVLDRVFDPSITTAIFVTDDLPVPESLLNAAIETGTPLFTSPVPSQKLTNLLRQYLQRMLVEPVTVHGVFLDVLGVGVLITGDSSIGKSELALELISRGHGLVADDIVELYQVAPDTLQGRCPELLRDFLEVRGLGVLNIRSVFGETAVRPKMNLKLLVHLQKPGPDSPDKLERLQANAGTQEILGIPVPRVVLDVVAGRNLAVLVEAAVRNYILQMRGIDSTRQFIERHERHMAEGAQGISAERF